MSCGVGCRRGSDPTLLWLWRRPVATAPIQPLAWEPPYAAGAAQEIATTTTKDKKTKKTKKQNKTRIPISVFLFLFKATPVAYGRSQARGQIGAVAAGLYQSHSNSGS